MDWIRKLIRGIWGLVQIVLVAIAYSIGIAGLYGGLVIGFFVVGLVLVLFGVNLDTVDNWLDAHSDWFEAAGMFMMRSVMALILLGCVFVVGKGIADHLPLPGRPSRHKKPRTAGRAAGKHRAASAGGGRRLARAKNAPRLSESGEPLPGTEGGGEGLAGEEGDKPMGCGAMIVAIIVGYFCYVGLTTDF